MDDIAETVKILDQGGIVIFPTDTAFGIGCRIDNIHAVKRLFAIRKRPSNKATPVLVDSILMAEKYLDSPLSNNVRRMMEKYWPGALTIVCMCKTTLVHRLVRGGGTTLGVRMPDHETTLRLIKGVEVPLLGPSANFHSGTTPYHLRELDPNLVKLVDFVLKGECKIRNVSTVIDCTLKPAKILRQGGVVL